MFTLWALFTVLAVENSLEVFVKYGIHLHCSKWEMSPKVFNANVGMNVNLIDPQLFHNSPHTFSLWVTREKSNLIKKYFYLRTIQRSIIILSEGKKHKIHVIFHLFSILLFTHNNISIPIINIWKCSTKKLAPVMNLSDLF